MRKKPFDKKEHEECAKDLRDVKKILQPYQEKIWKGYGVNSRDSRKIVRTIRLLDELRSSLDNHWYNIEDERSPYYGG